MKIIQQSRIVNEISYTYDFDRKDGSGFTFPCDCNCNIDFSDMTEEAKSNYEWCKNHPEEFDKIDLVRHYWSYRENAVGRCVCGNVMELYNEYQGACQCENCGRWYNLFGQALLDPEYWEDDYDY